MAVIAAICNSFKKELLDGVHLAADVYKIALIKPAPVGSFGKANVNYSELGTDEVANGNGYTTGGMVLANRASALSGDTAYVDFDDPVWATASIAAAYALIYNSTRAGKAVAIIDLGGTITSTNAAFTVQLPAAGATAIARIT